MSPDRAPALSPLQQGSPHFNTTRWTIVVSAGQETTAASKDALEQLCRSYWRPIYAYVRRRGYRAEESEDLTQAFLEHFLERKLVSVVDRQHGRFRTFLLHCCEYFLAKHWRDQRRLKRGGGRPLLSLEGDSLEQWYRNELADPMTPERLYEKRWALSVLALVQERLRGEWEAAGKLEIFKTLQLFLSGENESMTCARAALDLGMSEAAVRTAVHRLRRRYGEILRAEVAQTISSPDEIEDELQYLLSVL